MIVYRLVCEEGHEFDAWFRGSEAYEEQAAAGQIACAACGSHKVGKALMAPNLSKGRAEPQVPAVREKSEPSPAEIMDRMHALARQLRETVERDFENVGERFAEEVRLIHDGEADERGIYGKAKPEEVRELLEDGIPVAPLPDAPDKAN